MSKNKAVVPADMRRRARKIAAQASKLADQARPMTTTATIRAKQGAADAAEWAKPGVDMARVWMAVRMYRGSAAVQKKVAPKVALVMADTGKKLYPPKKRSRLLPAILSGLALLLAGAAAAAAIIMRKKRMAETMPPPPMPSPDDQARPAREAEVNGLSRTR
ncbi:MAG TPA: hypothetical protein VJT16_00660 [Streptosporangiaceae bacterium]|nr:hypothetical protein [Streptosporangiaceae bacterium]